MVDRAVLFEAAKAGPQFLEQAGMKCEFKVTLFIEKQKTKKLYRGFSIENHREEGDYGNCPTIDSESV